MKSKINRYLYAGFVLFGVYLLIFQQEYSNAAIYFGISLAFEPFDVEQKWQDKPKWQKAILLAHAALVFILIGYELTIKFL